MSKPEQVPAVRRARLPARCSHSRLCTCCTICLTISRAREHGLIITTCSCSPESPYERDARARSGAESYLKIIALPTRSPGGFLYLITANCSRFTSIMARLMRRLTWRPWDRLYVAPQTTVPGARVRAKKNYPPSFPWRRVHEFPSTGLWRNDRRMSATDFRIAKQYNYTRRNWLDRSRVRRAHRKWNYVSARKGE